MTAKIVKTPMKQSDLSEMAAAEFGDVVKAVVDVRQRIMAVGGELHSDEEVLLTENEGSKREDTWGINIYPKRPRSEWVEFDSMINIKPQFNNLSRDVEDPKIREEIRKVVMSLVKNGE